MKCPNSSEGALRNPDRQSQTAEVRIHIALMSRLTALGHAEIERVA